jgi:hypothetical protein
VSFVFLIESVFGSFLCVFPTMRSHPIRRFKFIPEEDELLKRLVIEYGTNDWERIAAFFPDRNVRQCRERWTHYLAKESRMTNPIPSISPSMTEALRSMVTGIDGEIGLKMFSTFEKSNLDGVISEQNVAAPTRLSVPAPFGFGSSPTSVECTRPEDCISQEQSWQSYTSLTESWYDEFLSHGFERDSDMLWFD